MATGGMIRLANVGLPPTKVLGEKIFRVLDRECHAVGSTQPEWRQSLDDSPESQPAGRI